jgi:hypothetical protein
MLIKVSISQDETKNCWAYSVCIGDGFHKIGYGTTYTECEKLARSGVKSAEKYLKNLLKN